MGREVYTEQKSCIAWWHSNFQISVIPQSLTEISSLSKASYKGHTVAQPTRMPELIRLLSCLLLLPDWISMPLCKDILEFILYCECR